MPIPTRRISVLLAPPPYLAVANFDAPGALTATDPVGPKGPSAAVAWSGATWAAAGGTATNTPTQGGELVTDGGMENWASATDLTSWTESPAGASTVNREGTIKNSGSFSVRLDISAGNESAAVSQTVTYPGGWLVVSMYVQGTVGKKYRLFIEGIYNFDVSLTADFVKKVVVVRTGANPSIAMNRFTAASSSIYFDDFSAKALTLSTLFSSVSVSVADVFASAAVVVTAGTQAGLVVNLDSTGSPANFVICYHDGTNVKLEKSVAGTYTTVFSGAVTYSAGAALRVHKTGTALYVTAPL